MKYEVKSEFVDQATGERYAPATGGADPVTFEPGDADQHARLVAAGCLLSEPYFDLSTKPVADMTRSELESTALDAFRYELNAMTDDRLREGVERFREHLADEDALDKKTVEQLKEIAEAEDVSLTGLTKKAEIVAAITAKRDQA